MVALDSYWCVTAEVVRLDITDQSSVDAAAALARDVGLLINNAADTAGGNLVTRDLDAPQQVDRAVRPG